MPKLREETYGSGDQTWLASTHGMRNARTGVIDPASFTKSTHFPDGFIRSGTPVNAANEAALTPWTGGATEKLGFVLFDAKVEGTSKLSVPLLRHGLVDVTKLPTGAFNAGTGSTNGFTLIGGN